MRLRSILPFTGLSRKNRANIYVQLGQMMDAGLPFRRCFQVLLDQYQGGSVRQALEDISECVQGGDSLASAFSHHPDLFPPMELRLIETADRMGTLPNTLDRLASFLNKLSGFWRTFANGLIYPAMLILTLVVVIPFIQELFLGSLERYFIRLTWGIVYFTVWLVGVVVIWRILSQISGFRHLVHLFVLKLPVFGKVVRQISHARFANTLSGLYTAGVSVPEALSLAAFSCGNETISRRLLPAAAVVKEGGSIREGLEQTWEFTPLSLGIIEVGEETGKLDKSLEKYAEYEEGEAEITIEVMVKFLPLLMYFGIAGIIGWKVVMTFMKYLSIYNL